MGAGGGADGDEATNDGSNRDGADYPSSSRSTVTVRPVSRSGASR